MTPLRIRRNKGRVVCNEHGRVKAYRVHEKWIDCRDRARVRVIFQCVICKKLGARVDAWKHRARRVAAMIAWTASHREYKRAYKRAYDRSHVEDVRISQKITRAKTRDARCAKKRADYARKVGKVAA